MSNGKFTQRTELRKHYRLARQQLSPADQRQAGEALRKNLLHSNVLLSARTIAAYWPDDGEINLTPTICMLQSQKKRIVLPQINYRHQMRFAHFENEKQLVPGRFNILQPKQTTRIISPMAIDIILVPMVAFDQDGHRLGRGGGFYDKFLARFKRHAYTKDRAPRELHSRPKIVGVAHACQQHDKLPVERWDFPMDAVVTDATVCYFHR